MRAAHPADSIAYPKPAHVPPAHVPLDTGEQDEASPLLRAILNLAKFHRAHEMFYASSPREQAVELQRHARTLQALADRWSTVMPSRTTPLSPFEGAEDLNDRAALQLDGVLFMEGEGQPAEIARLVRDLRVVADDSITTGQWLTTAMTASWDVAAALIDIDELAGVLGTRHRIISNDWLAAQMSTLAGRTLLRAADILGRVDFSPAALRADLAASALSPRRLYSAAELIGGAADLLSDSAGLVNDNEARWRPFRSLVEDLVRGTNRHTISPGSGVPGPSEPDAHE